MSLDIVKKLKPCEFEWKGQPKPKKNFGFIAQDLQEIFPSDEYSMVDNSNDFLKVDYYQIIPLLVKAIQELSDKIEDLEKSRCNFKIWEEQSRTQGSYSDEDLKENVNYL